MRYKLRYSHMQVTTVTESDAMWNRIFSKMLDSSVWLEPSESRLVWVTLLAAQDRDGIVQFGCIENVAARARVSIEGAREAIETFLRPDPKTPGADYEGRRIERVEGGYRLLNKGKYDLLGSVENSRELTRRRVAAYRSRKNGNGLVTPSDVNVNVNAEKNLLSEKVVIQPSPLKLGRPESVDKSKSDLKIVSENRKRIAEKVSATARRMKS